MSLGERIYQLRIEKGMSQGDLADALEVSRQSISKWETNASVPELDKLVRMSEVFGVTLDELVTGKEKNKEEHASPLSPPQTEPQVIYIEKPTKSGITAAQILGIILLSCSALCMILFACFGKRSYLDDVFFLCLPVAIWGVFCLVSKQPLMWSCWCGSAVWWIYLYVLSTRWENAGLLIFLGIVLVIASLGYTIYLHKKERIQIPAWGMALLTIALLAAALLLMLNLLPPVAGSVTAPSEVIRPG